MGESRKLYFIFTHYRQNPTFLFCPTAFLTYCSTLISKKNTNKKNCKEWFN